jgi:hypothetical protein
LDFAASIPSGSFGFRTLPFVPRLVAEPFQRWGRLPESVALIFSSLFSGAVVVGAGYLFGSQIAGPIAVIIFVAVNKLYVRDSLGEATVLPGEDVR